MGDARELKGSQSACQPPHVTRDMSDQVSLEWYRLSVLLLSRLDVTGRYADWEAFSSLCVVRSLMIL